MTLRLFDTNSYLASFDATITAFEYTKKGPAIILDQTAFFPEGGGQNADQGYIHTWPVLDVQDVHGLIYHYISLSKEEVPTVGMPVSCQINWQRRFDYMQQHSGEHIVSGLVHTIYGFNNVGFHLGDDVVTLDFDGQLTTEDVAHIETLANEGVFKNGPIHILFPSKDELTQLNYRSKKEIEGQIRIVHVENYDMCACCAPHVAHTGEIGLIKILSCQKYKSGVRMTMICGMRALSDYRIKMSNALEISNLLSVKINEIAEPVKKLQTDLSAARYQCIQAQETLIMSDLSLLPSDQTNVCYFCEQLSSTTMKKALNFLADHHTGYCGIFTGDDERGYQYLISIRNGDSRIIGEELKKHFSCRGGGKADMIQGKIVATQKEIEDVFADM